MDFLKNDISKLLEILGRDDSSEINLKKDTKYINELAQKENYEFKNPKIEKVAITIDKVANIPKQFQAIKDLFGMGSDLISMISGTGKFAENVKTDLKNKIPDIVTNEIKSNDDILKKLEANIPITNLPQFVGDQMEKTFENSTKYISFIDNLLDTADALDPGYKNKIGNTLLNITMANYNWINKPPAYVPKNEVFKTSITYDAFKKKINEMSEFIIPIKNQTYVSKYDGIQLPSISRNERPNIVSQLKNIVDMIQEHIKTKTLNLADQIQTGGNIDSVQNVILLALERKINILKAEELLIFLEKRYSEMEKNTQEKTSATTTTTQNLSIPLMTLISYNIGSLNAYDIELINYCQQLGLDVSTILAIYFSQNRHDISYIISRYAPTRYPALLNILRLKKLSASTKFRQNYGILSDEQVGIVWEKRTVWSN